LDSNLRFCQRSGSSEIEERLFQFYATSASLEDSLTLEGLRMAVANRRSDPGTTRHSDQRVQYASNEYVVELIRHGRKVNMVCVGNPYKNAMMESLLKTLKYEEVILC
jgi:transposase InsO family protein